VGIFDNAFVAEREEAVDYAEIFDFAHQSMVTPRGTMRLLHLIDWYTKIDQSI